LFGKENEMKRLAVTGALLLLAGCAPNESEMSDALSRNDKFVMTLAMLGGGLRPDQVAIEKSSCTDAQAAPGYVCDFRIGRKGPGGATNFSGPAKGRFFKSGGKWAVELDR
jgi:hypothetical protein